MFTARHWQQVREKGAAQAHVTIAMSVRFLDQLETLVTFKRCKTCSPLAQTVNGHPAPHFGLHSTDIHVRLDDIGSPVARAVDSHLVLQSTLNSICFHLRPRETSSLLAQAVNGHPVPHSGLNSTGEMRVAPGEELRRCAWHPGHGIACADLRDNHGMPTGLDTARAKIARSLRCSHAGEPWALCPRTVLKDTLKELLDSHGAKLHVGFELE